MTITLAILSALLLQQAPPPVPFAPITNVGSSVRFTPPELFEYDTDGKSCYGEEKNGICTFRVKLKVPAKLKCSRLSADGVFTCSYKLRGSK